MPMRVGEMMVIVRAQDFASRTLRRVSGELAGLSRGQALQMRQQQLLMRQAQTAERISGTMARSRGLKVIQQQIEAQRRLELLQSGTGAMQGPGGFVSRKKEIASLSASLGHMDTEIRKLDPSLRRLHFLVKDMPNASAFLDAAIDKNSRAIRRLGVSSNLTRQEIQAVTQAIRGLPLEKLDNVAHALSGIGRTMQLFGAVGTAAFGLAANQAANFNTEMSLAATQARDIGADANQVNLRITQLSEGFQDNGQEIGGVLDLMKEYPARANDMAAATYDIFSSMDLERSGIIDVTQGLGLLEKANQIAVAGGVDLADATSAMITVLNNFDPQLKNTTEQFDTMFDIVRFGRMRLSDFNIMMNKIAPAAADAGNSLRDVGGAMAFLTTVMPSQRMVATGISRLLEALRHPDVVAGLHMFGVEAKDASGKLRPLDAILQDIARVFPEVATGQKSAAEFFREISALGRGRGRGQIFTQEGRRAFSEILTHMDEYLDAQRRIDQNTNEFANAQEAQMQSIGVQWQIFLNRVRALVISIGNDAVPVFAELGQILKTILDWWERLNPETRQFIVRMGVLVSVGTLVGGVFLAIVGSMIAFEAMIRRVMMSGGGMMGMLTGMRALLARIAALAAISIILKAKMEGDPALVDFLMGAIAGGLAGAAFGGLPGAIAGAIIVPVTMKVMEEVDWDKMILEAMNMSHFAESNNAIERQFAQYVLNGVKAGLVDADRLTFKEFKKTMKQGVQFETGVHQTAAQAHRDSKKRQEEATKAAKKHTDALHAMYQAQLKAREENSRFKEELKDWTRQLTLATEQAGEDAVASLRNMYMQLEQVNRSAMGELFQGPWLTSQTFDLAKEWGIKPRIDDLIKDLDMSNARFAKWRSSLDKAFKRGLPREFINQMKQMGPEQGQGILDVILAADPEKVNTLIAKWKRNEANIKQQTKMDFSDEIQRFKDAGLEMGDAIKLGFQDAEVAVWFDKWIRATFPEVISAAVAQAVAEWKKANPAPSDATAKAAAEAAARAADAAKAGQAGRTASGAAGTTNTSTDNSKTATVYVNLPHGEYNEAQRENARRAAFATVNVLRAWW